MAENAVADMLGWVCFCWLVPLGLFAVMYGFATGLSNSWRKRGLDAGELYCGFCRFNLRGNGSRQCPECGKQMDAESILSKGYCPPMTSGARMVIVSLSCLAPVLLIGFGLGQVFAFNFVLTHHVTLFNESGNAGHIHLSRQGREGWPLGTSASTMQLYATGSTAGEAFSLTLRPTQGIDPANRIDDVLWVRISRAAGLDANSDAALSQRQHDALIAVIRDMDRGMTPSVPLSLNLRLSIDSNYQRYRPHPVYVIIVVLVSASVWSYFLFVTARLQSRIDREDLAKRQAIVGRLDEWIKKNRAALRK